jgi:23S rRNA pseudouridine1911/1915/1917 synthase
MKILYQDNWIIAFNKEAGELVQSDKSGEEELPPELKGLFVIHRLDRPVSGIVIFAKTAKAAARFSELFRNRTCVKTYMAIVAGEPDPPEGTLTHYLVTDTRGNKSKVVNEPVEGGRKAVLHYRLAGRTERYFFIEIGLETGRHHQIRAQLAFLGIPVRGDLKYGYPRSNKGGGISLHARSLEFFHPVKKKKLVLTAPYPEGEKLWQLLEEPKTT